jgi:hypothetical protein
VTSNHHNNKNHYNNRSGDKQSNSQMLIPLTPRAGLRLCTIS